MPAMQANLFQHIFNCKFVDGKFCEIGVFFYLSILPHHKYNENNKKRVDLTMVRRPKGNYEAFVKLVYFFIYLFCHTTNIMRTIKKSRFNNGEETQSKL